MKLGLGTAALGRPQYINIRTKEIDNSDLHAFKKQGFHVLEKAYQEGIRYFDTASGYGLAEELVLEWLQTKNDSTIEVATKWGYTYTANFDANAKVHEVKEHSIAKLKEQWNFSRQLLPYLKVYQIHSATLETGVLENKEVLEELAKLKKEHKLKIGITTSGINQVEVIKKALGIIIEGQQLFDVFQVTYNYLEQSLLEIYQELTQQNKTIVIKEAMANGRIFRNKDYPNYVKLYDILAKLAGFYNVGVDAITLKFAMQTLPNATILSGASNQAQLLENLKVNQFSLTQDEIDSLASLKVSSNYYWSERKKLRWN